MEFHMMNIIYAALSISAQTEKTTFSCKDDCTWTKHTGRWIYSAKDFEIPLCRILPFLSQDRLCYYPRAISQSVSKKTGPWEWIKQRQFLRQMFYMHILFSYKTKRLSVYCMYETPCEPTAFYWNFLEILCFKSYWISD